MTNREKLKSMTTEELGKLFCDMMESIGEKVNAHVEKWTEVYCCKLCPMYKLCRSGHAGIVEYLNQEAKEDA